MSTLVAEDYPAGSAARVMLTGATRISAESLHARLGARSPVSLGLGLKELPGGLCELVLEDSGERVGICATAAVARQTQQHFCR